MRKWVVSSIIAGLFLSMITTSQASFDSIPLGDYPRNSELYQLIKNESSLQPLNEIILLPKSLFDEKAAAGIITRISNLPETLLEKINEEDITLKLFTGKLTDNQTARYLAGQIPRGYNTQTTWDEVPGIGGSQVVLVKIGHSEKGKGHGSVNLELHEIAHSIDNLVFQNISKDKEFQLIWEEERGILFPGNSYFILHAEEYFAETFAMYYLNDKTKLELKKLAPQTFDFFQRLHERS
ncbi:toxin [Neobacillus sp. DY30]|uniref:anthrax toxin lethal factor-related metalloendopeptidase n=1 Tax=Neobacillus sp. DY30 TaxID=3047871 RepID=UPI0024BFC06C|nr:toxin [Neobacillus sp. DY30]WHX98991.1 toxin [Neobacillus sp. DY30]